MSTNFTNLWAEASRQYAETTGKKLEDLPKPLTVKDLIASVENQNKDYKHFRERSKTFTNILSIAVKPIELVGNLAAGAAGAVFPPSSMVFGAVMYLINAAHGVSESLDAIADLMEVLKDFTVRLEIYSRIEYSEAIHGKLTEILITVIDVLAQSTKQIKAGFLGRLKSFGKNALIGNDTKMQGLMAKLTGLTESENLLVGAETLVEVKETGRDVREMRVTMTSTSQGVNEMLGAMAESKQVADEERQLKNLKRIKQTLDPSGMPKERFEEIKRESRLIPGSGDWIRSEDAFQDWIQRKKSPILFVSGNPGCGKSFLAYNVISYLHDLAEDDSSPVADDSSVAYFFFRDNQVTTQSFSQAIRDLAYQLTQSNVAYSKYLASVDCSSAELQSLNVGWKTLVQDFWQEGRAGTTAYIILDGLDESLPNDRKTFFELLRDIEDVGVESNVQILMLGRPHVLAEIGDELEEPPTIYIDSSKNSADIVHYIEASIGKSRALSRVSEKLKKTIIQTLTQKAGGMFMWVKLMIAELNNKAKRGRQTDVEKALNEAPKDLTAMLKRLLETYSSTLSEDEASDLNDMLMWVTLAKRPLYLGELDGILRLKSAEGDGLIDLEGNLRKAYASLFTLTREDGLTTSDLLASHYQHNGITKEKDDDGDGEDDLDYPTEFSSNPKTTTIAFSHASISDFFRDPKQGRVEADGDHPPVGVDLARAQLVVAKMCVDVIFDDDLVERMKKAVSLRTYASNNWLEHIKDTDRALLAGTGEQTSVGLTIARMLYDEKYHPRWAGARNYLFWSDSTAEPLLPWIQDDQVVSMAEEELAQWLESRKEKKPLEIFEPAMLYHAKRWLQPGDLAWNVHPCSVVVYSWLARRDGAVIDSLPTPDAEAITKAAEFGSLEHDVEWHRRLAMTFREMKDFEASKTYFEKALELDPKSWLAHAGSASMLFKQEKYQEALEVDKVVIELLGEVTTDIDKFQKSTTHERMGDSYSALASEAEESDRPGEAEEFELRSLEQYKLAIKYNYRKYNCIGQYMKILLDWAFLYLPHVLNEDTAKKRQRPSPWKVPSLEQIYDMIMEMLHDQNNTQHSDGHTNLTRWLWTIDARSDELQAITCAAKATGQVEWLQDRYIDAMNAARGDLETVKEAIMGVCLAELYFESGVDEKMLQLLEKVAFQRTQYNQNDESELGGAQRLALEGLGQYYIGKLAEDAESRQDRSIWLEKLEWMLQRTTKGINLTMREKSESLQASNIAVIVAAWYSKQGRTEEAFELVKPHIKDAMVILGDDDPNNDSMGYYYLGLAFMGVRDDINANAIFHSFRQIKNGFVVLSSDPEEDSNQKDNTKEGQKRGENGIEPSGDKKKEDEENGDGKEEEGEGDDEDGPVSLHWCDGDCERGFANFDNCYSCRYDLCTYCEHCYKQLLRDELPYRALCKKTHEFMYTPPLETRYKKDELCVDGKVVTVEEWKKGIKKRWGL